MGQAPRIAGPQKRKQRDLVWLVFPGVPRSEPRVARPSAPGVSFLRGSSV